MSINQLVTWASILKLPYSQITVKYTYTYTDNINSLMDQFKDNFKLMSYNLTKGIENDMNIP